MTGRPPHGHGLAPLSPADSSPLLQPHERALIEELHRLAERCLARQPPHTLAYRITNAVAQLVAKRLARVDINPDDLIDFGVSTPMELP